MKFRIFSFERRNFGRFRYSRELMCKECQWKIAFWPLSPYPLIFMGLSSVWNLEPPPLKFLIWINPKFMKNLFFSIQWSLKLWKLIFKGLYEVIRVMNQCTAVIIQTNVQKSTTFMQSLITECLYQRIKSENLWMNE